ncbi:GNAT family N-acetyltransferase [Devosia sp. XJ19-1]|uniref:GNAT family N-acetyltransferase n=1 Tax=Devosia ureilytica TaxID=2952754 RepID=A0A9Q4AP97_9HYPH|nr:GNAT family N-acetyltransferase [Devosia ureilytica]MCP8883836.1 GNAT family N-acetyltransferase [Devosia ureilytica]MCP8887444.1 GNAT family N-acetyltransferase [Devosia ureilytica]
MFNILGNGMFRSEHYRCGEQGREAVRPEDSIVMRVLGTLDEIEACADAWREIEVSCADPMAYFQSYDWCRNWVRQFGDIGRPYVITLWREETLLALWPRMIVEAAGIRRLETLGVPHSQYCGALVRRGTSPKLGIAQKLEAAALQSGCDVTICRAVPEGTALAGFVADKPEVRGADNVASMLDLSAFASVEHYTNGLGKLQKRNRNRRRNHLARLGALDFAVIWPNDPRFAELARHCTQMKRRWLRETRRYSAGFSIDGYDDFLAGLPGDPVAGEGACLSMLRAGGRVVSLEIGFIRQRHYYAYVGGFDWALRHLSPGKVQMEMTIAWLIENRIKTYDLLINPADYKASWTNTSVVVRTHAQPLTWKGHVYASAWLPTLRPALKSLHGRLPTLIDRITSVLRPAVCLLLYV